MRIISRTIFLNDMNHISQSFHTVYIQECDWEAFSICMKPKSFKTLLEICTPDSLGALKRCKTSVMTNIFRHLEFRLFNLRQTPQHFFEHYMTESGFLPTSKNILPNNSLFGFVSDGVWCEWSTPSVALMRMYWDLMLQGVKRENAYFDKILRQAVSILPGKQTTCGSCHWVVPISEMDTDTICCYCSDKDRYPTLTTCNGALICC